MMSTETRTELAGMSDRIRQRMEALRMTQSALAEKAGLSQVAMHKILNGGRTRHIVAIAAALECSAEWLEAGVEAGRDAPGEASNGCPAGVGPESRPWRKGPAILTAESYNKVLRRARAAQQAALGALCILTPAGCENTDTYRKLAQVVELMDELLDAIEPPKLP